LAIACDKSANKTGETTKNTAPLPNKPAPPAPVYPGIQPVVLATLYAESDYMDYIFHDLPFAMSQDTKESIQSSLKNISADPQGSIPPGCKPMARQMFHVKGEIVREFDVYYSEGCAFFALVENEKPIGMNKMTESGQNFYKSMIEQAMKTRQNLQQ